MLCMQMYSVFAVRRVEFIRVCALLSQRMSHSGLLYAQRVACHVFFRCPELKLHKHS